MKTKKPTRYETAVTVAEEAIREGLILQVETTWYGYGLTFTAGPYHEATGFNGFNVFIYGGGRTPPNGLMFGKTSDPNELAHWVASHARIPDIRKAVKKAKEKV